MRLSSFLRIELDEVGLGFLFMLTKVGKHQQTWYECWLGERLSVIHNIMLDQFPQFYRRLCFARGERAPIVSVEREARSEDAISLWQPFFFLFFFFLLDNEALELLITSLFTIQMTRF